MMKGNNDCIVRPQHHHERVVETANEVPTEGVAPETDDELPRLWEPLHQCQCSFDLTPERFTKLRVCLGVGAGRVHRLAPCLVERMTRISA